MSKKFSYNLEDFKKTLPYLLSIGATIVVANMVGVQSWITEFFQKIFMLWGRLVELMGEVRVLELGTGFGYIISSAIGVVLKKFLTTYPVKK